MLMIKALKNVGFFILTFKVQQTRQKKFGRLLSTERLRFIKHFA